MGGIMYSSRYDTINLPANNKELMSTISSLVVDGQHKHVYNFSELAARKILQLWFYALRLLVPEITSSSTDKLDFYLRALTLNNYRSEGPQLFPCYLIPIERKS